MDVPELALIKDLPTTCDDTKILRGVIGEYGAVARRSGDDLFVGCLNAGEPRALELALDFLPVGTKFEATICTDKSKVPTRTKVGIEQMPVGSTTVLKTAMNGQGGGAQVADGYRLKVVSGYQVNGTVY